MAGTSKSPPEISQIDDYIFEYEIGRGSFAIVYKGHHKTTKEPVAIKSVLRSKLTKKLLENLASEISILKGIRHDHIVALVDCKHTETHIHLIMEYCSQGDLSQYIKRKGDGPPSLPPPPGGGLHEVVVRHFLKQLASALEFLRSKNLIHRDLKPQNLLLHPSRDSREGSGYGLPVLKIADFGFARSLPHLSLAETLCGSPLYMAPEILRYEKYDAKADLWSVGTVLYEMCTGKPPFRANNHVELLKKIELAQDAITFPGESGADDRSKPSSSSSTTQAPFTSEDIRDLIRQLLKRNPVERISFEEFFMSPPVSTRPQHGRSRSLREDSQSLDMTRIDSSELVSKRTSTPGLYPDSSHRERERDRAEKKQHAIYSTSAKEPMEKYMDPATRSRPRSLRGRSPSSTSTDSRPPLQLPLSSPKGSQPMPPLSDPRSQPSSQPISTSSRRIKSTEAPAEASNRIPVPQASSQPYRRSALVGVPDVARRYSAPEDDSLLDKDYVVVEKRAVELNALADEVAASPTPSSTGRFKKESSQHSTLSPPIPTSLTQYRTPPPPFIPNFSVSNQSPPVSSPFYSTTPPFALPTLATEESRAFQTSHRLSNGSSQPIPTQSGIRSGSPRESGATSALAKALTIASMRLFGASSSPPSWKHGNTLIGFTDANSKASGPTEVSPEELAVVQAIEDTAHKAYVVSQFADSKMEGVRSMSSLDFLPSAVEQEPSREAIMAEEAFFLYLRSLALLQAGMDVARRYWEERRQDSKPASTRLNSGVQWIRDRFNECLEKAEAAKSRSGIDHREGSGVIIEKLIYERALELSKNAAMKEISSDEYSESERSYQTSIWMLHAILDGAGADGQSEAIEEDDREILNKFIRSIEGRLNLLRRRAARG